MGATVSKDGKIKEEVLEKLKEQIKAAYPNMQPDSTATVHNRETLETHQYEVVLKGDPQQNEPLEVEFKELPLETPINSATSCGIAITNMYHKTSETWIGCVHFG